MFEWLYRKLWSDFYKYIYHVADDIFQDAGKMLSVTSVIYLFLYIYWFFGTMEKTRKKPFFRLIYRILY